MKLLLITAAAVTLLGACDYLPDEDKSPAVKPPICGQPNEPVVIGYAKDGGLIYDDQATLSAPCTTVERPHASKTPRTPEPPTPLPPVDKPPVDEPTKGNNGWGNGDQDAPGGSEPNNNAENNGGNHNGRDEAPGRSWHE